MDFRTNYNAASYTAPELKIFRPRAGGRAIIRKVGDVVDVQDVASEWKFSPLPR